MQDVMYIYKRTEAKKKDNKILKIILMFERESFFFLFDDSCEFVNVEMNKEIMNKKLKFAGKSKRS